MSSKIKLLNSQFPWKNIEVDGVQYFFKGNIFYNNELLMSEKVINVLSEIVINCRKEHYKHLDKVFRYFTGEFSVVIDTPYEVICFVDRVRSIPLFYMQKNNNLIISDDAYYIKNATDTRINEKNLLEFLVTGYVTGDETLFDDLKQINSGEIMVYNKDTEILKKRFYHRYIYKEKFNLSEDEMLDLLDSVLTNVFKRLVESTISKKMHIFVPLSGGLDSRIIVAILKKYGIEDVTCFSYGKKRNLDAKISRQVAEALGYKWLFVEYTKKKWDEYYHSEEMRSYIKYSGNLASSPHIQDILAVTQLHNEGKLPSNSVFIPGHTGDMISGGHIPRSYDGSLERYDFKIFLKDNLKKHYNLWKWDNWEIKQIFEEKCKKSIDNMTIDNHECCANAIELFDFNERQAKFIVNSVRNYEFLGYSWRIPFWDLELIDFFLRVPVEYKINQSLYKKYAIERLFTKDLKFLSQIPCTTKLKRDFSERYVAIRKIHSLLYIIKNNHINKTWADSVSSIFDENLNNMQNLEDFPLLTKINMNPKNRSHDMTPLAVIYLRSIETQQCQNPVK